MKKIHYFLTEDDKLHELTTAYTEKRKDGTLKIELHEKVSVNTLSGMVIDGDKTIGKISIKTGKNGEFKVFKEDEGYEDLEIVD
jgi:hypothetical protein